jgi:chromosomal replication initiation ATPase DnaA
MSEHAVRVIDAEFVEAPVEAPGRRVAFLVKRLRERKLYQFVDEVAQRYGVTIEMVVGRDRHASISAARHAVCYALRYDLPDRELSLPEIGRIIDRDHTTVMSSLRRHASRKTERFLLRRPPQLARTRPDPMLLMSQSIPDVPLPEIPDLEVPSTVAESAVA